MQFQFSKETKMSADRDIQSFRANYYHKLGSTSAVEAKKNLTKLFKSVPIDIKKLEQYCQHFNVPHDFRCELWKILLNVTPIYRSTAEYVAKQRQELYEELSRVVDVMRYKTTEQQDNDLKKLAAMYLVESRIFMQGIDDLFELEQAQLFYDVASAIERFELHRCDVYWISRNFCNLVQDKVHPHIPKLIERTQFHLQREDNSDKLCNHLHSIRAYDKMPLEKWFTNCFADVLPDTTFDRVWDKIIAGSSLILAFIAVALILIYRRPILVMKNSEDVLNLFSQVQTDTADEAVRRGIEFWQRNGGKLTPSSSRASPAIGSGER